jgi:biopolymer transport protein TolR
MGMSTGGGGLNSDINVTPMVDIMLVLLIIFMVVTPMLQQGITVNIPKELNTPDEDPNIIKESSVVVAIPEDGKYYIQKDPVQKDELKRLVEERLSDKAGADRIVYVKSGVGVSYGEVVDIIDTIRKAGVDQIGLVADKRKGQNAGANPNPS